MTTGATLFFSIFYIAEWDTEWPGPQVIVEVSETATITTSSTNGTNVESMFVFHSFILLSNFTTKRKAIKIEQEKKLF